MCRWCSRRDLVGAGIDSGNETKPEIKLWNEAGDKVEGTNVGGGVMHCVTAQVVHVQDKGDW